MARPKKEPTKVVRLTAQAVNVLEGRKLEGDTLSDVVLRMAGATRRGTGGRQAMKPTGPAPREQAIREEMRRLAREDPELGVHTRREMAEANLRS